MHETGLLAAAVAQVTAAANGRPLARVEVALGPGIDAEVAAQSWRSAAAGGAAEHATVVWTRRAHTLACFRCAARYPGDPLTPCPECGGNGLVESPAPDVEILDWLPAAGR